MKIDWAFLKIVALSWGGVVVLAVYPMSVYATGPVVDGFVAGGLMSLAHLLLGYAFIELGFEKSNTSFLKIVLGGSVVRLLLLVGGVFLLVRVYGFDSLWLMLSLLLFYGLNLTLEIYLLQKKVSLKR
ncbi:MAG: hypothetical protein WEB62_05255 [Bacteroidota bacterium]